MATQTSIKTECPECGAEIVLKQGTERNEIVICSQCQSDLEVVSINGNSVELQLAPEEEEDWGE